MYLMYCKQQEFRGASSLQGKQTKSGVQTIEENLDFEKITQNELKWLKMMQLC